MRNKIIRTLVILISLILSLALYSSEYNIKNDVPDIESHISEYIGIEVSVINHQKIDNVIYVYFRDKSGEYIGNTILYRGLNFRYQLRQVQYGTDNKVLNINEFETLFKRYWAVFGTNYDNRISTIIFEGEEGEIILQNIEQYDEILLLKDSNNTTPGMSWVYTYILLDSEGNDITNEMRNYLTATGSSGHAKGKAELFVLNFICLVVIAIGIWFSFMLKPKDWDSSVDFFT